ncbi:ATP-binding protein [Streptomyces sp. URMC 129]|uniref:ATP-binding protein n=1 Tax=Streptomyces sp. URMC 129 TaxID=3423407 RepID=UPI003F1C0EB7
MTKAAMTSSVQIRSCTWTLHRRAESAEEARALVRAALSAWQLDDLTDVAALLVSELVTNSVRHTRGDSMEITVARTGWKVVRVVVTDTSCALPIVRSPRDDEVRGRGLILVEALTARWGADLVPGGKRVWGELVSGREPDG